MKEGSTVAGDEFAGKDQFNRRAFLGGAGAMALTGGNLPLLGAGARLGEKYDFDTPYNRFGTDCIKWDAQARGLAPGLARASI